MASSLRASTQASFPPAFSPPVFSPLVSSLQASFVAIQVSFLQASFLLASFLKASPEAKALASSSLVPFCCLFLSGPPSCGTSSRQWARTCRACKDRLCLTRLASYPTYLEASTLAWAGLF